MPTDLACTNCGEPAPHDDGVCPGADAPLSGRLIRANLLSLQASARRSADAYPEGSGNRASYEGAWSAYAAALSLLEDPALAAGGAVAVPEDRPPQIDEAMRERAAKALVRYLCCEECVPDWETWLDQVDAVLVAALGVPPTPTATGDDVLFTVGDKTQCEECAGTGWNHAAEECGNCRCCDGEGWLPAEAEAGSGGTP